jgi:polyamine:H+ symporter
MGAYSGGQQSYGSYGTVDDGASAAIPNSRSASAATAGAASSYESYHEQRGGGGGHTPGGHSSTSAVYNAVGKATRFVLRRRNVRRQTFGDVIRSMRRPSGHAYGDASAPPSAYGGDPSSEFVGLESLRAPRPPTLHPEAKLGTMALMSAVASVVLCSRFGGEAVVGAGGPYFALVGLATIPWVWYLPTGLVVAELSTSVPSNAGVLMWTNVAFPPFVSFFCVFLTLLLNIAGLAVSAALVVDYFARAVSMPYAVELLCRALSIVLGCAVNAWTIDGLSLAMQVITVLTTIPFLVITCIQLFGHGFSVDAMSQTPASVNFPVFFSYLAFTHSGLENLGSLVEDTKQPEKTMFRAIAPAMLASFFIYFMPFAAGISATYDPHNNNFSAWQPGYWGHVAGVIGGSFFRVYFEWGGVFARFASLLGTLACAARLLAGMGTMNAFPNVVSNFLAMYHDTRLTPINAVTVVSTAALPFAVLLSTDDLVAVFQVLSCVRLLIAVYAAFFVLRVRHPELPRPYRFPLGTVGSAILLLPSIVFVIAVMICGAALGTAPLAISISSVVLGLIVAVLWVKFLKPEGLAGTIEEFNVNDIPPSSFIEDNEEDGFK